MIASFLTGMNFQENDEVVWLDLVPNQRHVCLEINFSVYLFTATISFVSVRFMSGRARYAEYGRACVRRLLEGETRPKLSYYGMFRKDQKQVVANIEGEIFEHWDGLPTSPPKTRPRDPAPHLTAIAGLSLMSLDSVGQPGWPDHVLNKFKADSEHRRKLEKMKADFLQEFKVPAQAKASVSRGPVRVTGAPDFTVDSAEPLDVNRVVDLEKVAPPDSEKRRELRAGFGQCHAPSWLGAGCEFDVGDPNYEFGWFRFFSLLGFVVTHLLNPLKTPAKILNFNCEQQK